MKTILVLIILSMGLLSSNYAKQQDKPCKLPIEYENHNQIPPDPLSISTIYGYALEVGRIPMSGVCISLFTEDTHKVVASTITNKKGYFKLNKIPLGQYELVAKYSPFCTANLSIYIVQKDQKSTSNNERIILYMMPTEIDRCSYGYIDNNK